MALNRCIFIGRLVKEAEVRYTPNGTAVTSFTVAVNRLYKKGEETEVDFLSMIAWRETAEFVAKYFAKGDPIQVVGKLQTRKYTDKNGEQRTAFEIKADEVSFVEGYRRPLADEAPQKNAFGEKPNFESLNQDDELPF